MKKKICSFLLTGALSVSLLTGCTSAENVNNGTEQVSLENSENQMTETETAETETETEEAFPLEDGLYTATFTTDSTMFHVNETYEDKGQLTVKDGKATIHIVLASDGILNLFLGTAEDAQKEGAELLQPTLEEVAYSDGTTDVANAFDVPVPVYEEEFELALVGTKGTWYDHKVMVSDAQPLDDTSGADETSLEDGTYSVEVALEGGTGKASLTSPTELLVEDGCMTLTLTWSSPYYDYMIVDGQTYEPVNTEGNSVFEIPVEDLDQTLEVVADTTAMSQPHEIDYTITITQ